MTIAEKEAISDTGAMSQRAMRRDEEMEFAEALAKVIVDAMPAKGMSAYKVALAAGVSARYLQKVIKSGGKEEEEEKEKKKETTGKRKRTKRKKGQGKGKTKRKKKKKQRYEKDEENGKSKTDRIKFRQISKLRALSLVLFGDRNTLIEKALALTSGREQQAATDEAQPLVCLSTPRGLTLAIPWEVLRGLV